MSATAARNAMRAGHAAGSARVAHVADAGSRPARADGSIEP
jgi:hypothetical protein